MEPIVSDREEVRIASTMRVAVEQIDPKDDVLASTI